MNLKKSILTVAILLTTLISQSAPVQAKPFAYITNQGDGTVSVIDTATDTVVDTIPVGKSPWGVAIHPDGSTVYVTSGTTVSVIDTATNTVSTTIPVGGDLRGIAITPDGSTLYIANAYQNVSVVDTATSTMTKNMVGPPNVFDVAVHPDGSKLYATGAYGNTLIYNTALNRVIDRIEHTGATGIAIHPDGSMVYEAFWSYSEIGVIDTATNTVVDSVPVGTSPLDGNGPNDVAVHPDGSAVYAIHEGINTVSVIDTATNTVTDEIQIGSRGFGVAVHPDGTKVYSTNSDNDSVSVIDTATNTVIKTIPVGSSPWAIGLPITPYVAPTETIIYGMNSYSLRDVIEINLTKNSSQRVDDLRFDTQAIGQDPITGRVYYFEWEDSGNELAYWDPVTGLEEHVDTYDPELWGIAKRAAFGPDGLLYVMDDDGMLYTYDTAANTGEWVYRGQIEGITGIAGDMAFSPDGKLFVVTYHLFSVNMETLNATPLDTDMLPAGAWTVWTGLAYCDGTLYASLIDLSTDISDIYRIDLVYENDTITDTVVTWLFSTGTMINDLTSCPAVLETNGCEGDFYEDGDIDGLDLDELSNHINLLDLSAFASNYGKVDCADNGI